MALTNQDLQEISKLLEPIQNDIQVMRNDIQDMRNDIQDMSQRITSLELHIENETDRNIRILAENHLNIIDNVNAAVNFQRKDLVFEVQISDLQERVKRLEESRT